MTGLSDIALGQQRNSLKRIENLLSLDFALVLRDEIDLVKAPPTGASVQPTPVGQRPGPVQRRPAGRSLNGFANPRRLLFPECYVNRYAVVAG